jgi:diguanylate cyclase (GGDEF)-like protein
MVKARVRLHLNLKRKQELLEQYAFIDALTEVPNRRRFDEVLDNEWNRAARSRLPLSLIFMDIDKFKNYNDTYGHGRGDDCLRKVAGAIKKSMRRAGDFVARYGGEEFAVVLPHVTHAEAMTLAEQIQKNVGELAIRHDASDAAAHVSLSLGVATTIPEQETAATILLEAADKMLYEAKNTGRNTIRGIDLG